MQLRRALLALALCTATALTGCRPDAATHKAESMDESTTTRKTFVPPADSGSITGTVTFEGKLPATTIDTTMDPACSMGGAPDHLPVEQIVATTGKLANVYVYVKSGPPTAMQAGPVTTAPVVMDQQHCRYVPHVVALMQGGSVEFHNSDPTMHNIHTEPTTVGNQVIDISQSPRGAPQTKTFSAAEVMLPVRCNNHPWMNAFINVSPTPFFAVSDAQGHFTISGLPPGEYDLVAVQEKLGSKAIHVSVPPKGAAALQIAYKAS